MTAESPAGPGPVALYYHDEAFQIPRDGKELKGRTSAGGESLDALRRSGPSTRLPGGAHSSAAGRPLGARWQQLPAERRAGRDLRPVSVETFPRDFLPAPPAPVIHFPNPP